MRNGAQHLTVGVVAGGLHAHDATGGHEAGQGVDVAIGVVVGEHAVEPQDAVHAEGLRQPFRHFRLGQVWVALG
jgi:hypothetical protein